nr:PREDICTED: nck-associated protein 5 isoform X1 [Latimeria chalumnae]|eukprot:XP_006003089.1 PREDICTED: nck-associated protein 5 isoform X1 [Latimeria chalumnae]
MEKSRQQDKKELWKRLSLDSSLMDYMDSNKYIEELLKQLEDEQKNVRREKLAVARLQREVARSKSERTMREKLIHELEEERRLRLESEKQVREVTLESECSRVQMHALQEQFSRMEETVRNLLQNQGSLEQNAAETMNIMKVYQAKLSDDSGKHKEAMQDTNMAADEDCRSESSVEEEKEKTKLLLERLRALEAENSALAMENENQREQYERCLDEVANQVVQALLTQKDLREECLKLRTRVFDLEQQNRTLSVLFQQKVRPASDLLLQKLHSRILDLSSGDLLSEAEKNRSLMQSQSTEVQIHESQQNVKSGIPVLKCQSQLNLTRPSRLYPRSSCSSSELSLSSACSEYSSGSYTWNDGKTCSKTTSVNWEKRVSVGSSVPSNLSSPVEEIPPTRKKENHILEGLKKLQKRKVPLEPSSLVSKWGYKDCMNSNEGIYSPGIKCGSHSGAKGQSHCKPLEIGLCAEHSKHFIYDSDSHDDADDESSNPALIHQVPSKDCKSYCKKLTHSISDSLFGWEQNGKPLTERISYFSSKERPEKLTSAVNGFQSSVKSCASLKPPILQFSSSTTDIDCKDLNLQLSDIDDIEVLDELHVESSDEKSPSDILINPFSDKQTKNSDRLSEPQKNSLLTSEKGYNKISTYCGDRPKTFAKQHKVIKKTSSEECITVIFDAEDGEPIEFSSHQSGVVSLTRNEISINQQQTLSTAEYTELIPQVNTTCQNEVDARNYTVLESPENQTEQNSSENNTINKKKVGSSIYTSSVNVDKLTLQVPQPQRLIKPIYNVCYKANCVSSVQPVCNQRQNLTKLPNRGKLPQKTNKAFSHENSNPASPSGPQAFLKSPSSPPVKLSRFVKTEGATCNLAAGTDLSIPQHNTQLPQSSKSPCKNNGAASQSNRTTGSPLLPRHHIDPSNYREPPTRDRECELQQEPRSPSPPPPPGRSSSLLIRPNYEHSPPLSIKAGITISTETAKTVSTVSALKSQGVRNIVLLHNQSYTDVQHKKPKDTTDLDLGYPHLNSTQKRENLSEPSHSILKFQSPTKSCTKKCPLKTYQDSPETAIRTSKNSSIIYNQQKCSSTQSTFLAKKGQSHENGLPQQHKSCSSLPSSPQCQKTSVSESSESQVHNSQAVPHSFIAENATGLQLSHEKGLKTRIPTGFKALVKSPQLLRKSSTVPGKNEKDNINAASKVTVVSSKSKQDEILPDATTETKHIEETDDRVDNEKKEDPSSGTNKDVTSTHSVENGSNVVDKIDGVENKSFFKRSVSANCKPYLKPALGMNGAKARSQSFSIQIGERPSNPILEGSGKVRTQIITNTTDRGNSLTRQNSTIEGFQNKPGSGSPAAEILSYSPKVTEYSYSRQGSYGSMSSSGSQHGSPSKLPCRTAQKVEGSHTSKCEGNRSPPQKELHSPSPNEKLASKSSKQTSQPEKSRYDSVTSPNLSLESTAPNAKKLQSPTRVEMNMLKRQVSQIIKSEAPERVSGTTSGNVPQPTIEEKVMMGIQENVQKGHGQEKLSTPETKQKTGPSIASWFGFRKSKLPALSGKKSDVSKSKEEKKPGSGFGSKQGKADKKKEKKKTEQQPAGDKDLSKKNENNVALEGVLTSRTDKVPSQEAYCDSQVTTSESTDFSPTTCMVKNHFMKELLNRVDKKTAQQTESGSNHVSYRNVSKGSSQGSTLPSNSINNQGDHKKNTTMKAGMEIQHEMLTKEISVKVAANETEHSSEVACQDHVLVSSCQMRTLDSGIGTFPLPDSTHRATGRHLPKPEHGLETQVFTSQEQELLPSGVLPKAKTLEREVPSATESCSPGEGIISYSVSDPAMVVKVPIPFQSRLPKPATSGK